jgi:putative ABC transport system permease protein
MWRWLKSRLKPLTGRRKLDAELDRELQSHLELEAQELRDSGVAAGEAGYAARRALGNTVRVAEDVRDSWGFQWLENFLRDLRYGARSLRKSPGFTAVAVLTLALGIGTNSAIFSVVDSVMLQPLPFPDSGRLVRIYSTKNGTLLTGFANPGGPSYLDVQDFIERGHSLDKVVVYDSWRKNVSLGAPGAEPEQMRVGLVPAGFFEILGVQPVLGRNFTTAEGQEGKGYVAAISARVWRERYDMDPAILGRTIRINAEPYTIVAVIPDVIPDWMEPAIVGVWTPHDFAQEQWTENSRGSRGFATLGRLLPGISLEQAQKNLTAVAADLAATHAEDDGVGVAVTRLADTRAGAMRPMLFLLMGAVSLILLIACVNLANLLLARNSARQREMAVRTALGAGTKGLVRQLLAETLLLSFVGGAVGLGLAHFGVAPLMSMQAVELLHLGRSGVDWRVLAFTLVISLATSLLFGLAPALSGTRLNLVDALKQGGRSGTPGQRSNRMRHVLVVTEMAMCLMLLVGAGLLVQSMMRLQAQGLGIRQDHLLKAHVYLPGTRYPDPAAITRFSDEFGARVRAIPGVVDASITTIIPPKNGWTQMLEIPGHPATRLQDVPSAQFGVSDAKLMKTMGVPLLRGRDFSESDGIATPPVALISEEFRRRYFPAQDPLGLRVHIGPPRFLGIPRGENVSDDADVTIVGVVGDFKNVSLALPPEPQITVLYSQHALVNYGFKDIVIRTAADPHLLVPEIRRRLHELDPEMPLADVKTMDEVVEQQTGGQRFTTVLLSMFAAAGLGLAIVGIYGVISYLVARRTQELAVRLALGATPANILWLVLRQGLTMGLVGAGIGLLGAFAARQLMSGLLFGISPVDPLTFAGGAGVLLTVALMASAIPGARAMRIPLVTALRED